MREGRDWNHEEKMSVGNLDQKSGGGNVWQKCEGVEEF